MAEVCERLLSMIIEFELRSEAMAYAIKGTWNVFSFA